MPAGWGCGLRIAAQFGPQVNQLQDIGPRNQAQERSRPVDHRHLVVAVGGHHLQRPEQVVVRVHNL